MRATKQIQFLIKLLDFDSKQVYAINDLRHLLADSLTRNLSLRSVVKDLVRLRHLTQVDLPTPRRASTFYIKKGIPFEFAAVSIDSKAYLCHETAARLHELVDKPSHRIYVNVEQRLGSPLDAKLEQSRIDAAFRRPPRTTTNITKNGKREVCLVNGKNTGCLGVIEHPLNVRRKAYNLRITDLERTMIDLTTRPSYGGGVHQVLRAFERARPNLSIEKLVDTLHRIGHIYPYHQCIGFYLEASGEYSADEIKPFRDMSMEFDFYLENKMEQTVYVPQWRLYVPNSLLRT